MAQLTLAQVLAALKSATPARPDAQSYYPGSLGTSYRDKPAYGSDQASNWPTSVADLYKGIYPIAGQNELAAPVPANRSADAVLASVSPGANQGTGTLMAESVPALDAITGMDVTQEAPTTALGFSEPPDVAANNDVVRASVAEALNQPKADPLQITVNGGQPGKKEWDYKLGDGLGSLITNIAGMGGQPKGEGLLGALFGGAQPQGNSLFSGAKTPMPQMMRTIGGGESNFESSLYTPPVGSSAETAPKYSAPGKPNLLTIMQQALASQDAAKKKQEQEQALKQSGSNSTSTQSSSSNQSTMSPVRGENRYDPDTGQWVRK